MKKNKKVLLIVSIFIFLFGIMIFSADNIHAAEPLLNSSDTTKYSDNCKTDGDCELNDLLRVLVRSSEILLGLVGSLALLAFVIGGVFMLISAGNKEYVDRGRKIITGAVIGLVIVFLSYAITQFAFRAMGLEKWESNTTYDPNKEN